MRKNKLIELLQEIEGDPEVLVWNGQVGDWMGLKSKIHDRKLSRMSRKKYLHFLNLEQQSNGLPELGLNDFEYDEEWVFDDVPDYNRHDQNKNVIMLEPKQRGISTFDRAGDISY
jgi:hypothetical protein